MGILILLWSLIISKFVFVFVISEVDRKLIVLLLEVLVLCVFSDFFKIKVFIFYMNIYLMKMDFVLFKYYILG